MFWAVDPQQDVYPQNKDATTYSTLIDKQTQTRSH